MNNKKIILASASPRRIEIIRNRSLEPIIMPANIDETLPFAMKKESAVMYLAFKKALDVESRLDKSTNQIIIAADTIVYYNKIIGKPKNKNEAYDILSMLRGKSHSVITGVSLIHAHTASRCAFYESSQVFFKSYDMDELSSYLDSEDPYDKAGGYNLQGTFSKYVDHYQGDPENIIGFPWTRIEQELSLLMQK